MKQKLTYSEKLKDPRWQKKRLEILQRDNWTCQQCCDTESTLHVHHRRYLPGKEPWDIPNEYLVTLCESCHEFETEEIDAACHDLIAMVREKFFAGSIKKLAEAFHALEIHYECQVTADVIKHFLSDKERYLELENMYFSSIGDKSGKKDPF
jgi:hypothetical protein